VGLVIPAGILRIPVFSAPVALFSQESQFLFLRNFFGAPSVNPGDYASCDPRDTTTTTTMATGDDNNDVDGNGMTGNKVGDDGDGAMGDDNDNNDDGDDDDDGDGDSAMGSGATGYDDDDDGDGR